MNGVCLTGIEADYVTLQGTGKIDHYPETKQNHDKERIVCIFRVLCILKLRYAVASLDDNLKSTIIIQIQNE